jgi:pyruvate/2-oxoglutarate dehydrogenase complex dihydrolipoamide dehydrogenase (E3) component
MATSYDLVIIGAGSGGLVAARFAAHLGARVALVEQNHVGGDCTWTGCVPSKALIRVARAAHEVRTAALYGIVAAPPAVEMAQVRAYVHRAITAVYQQETPEQLAREGVEVVLGSARFVDAHTIHAGERRLAARHVLITTGARPAVPAIPRLREVPFLTYEQIFDNERLPAQLVVIGAGPLGVELAQAYARLGAQVTVIGPRLLPRDEPEAAEVLSRIFAREGIALVQGHATAVRRAGDTIVVAVGDQDVRGDMLFVAAGRTPNVDGLALDNAGVTYSANGIAVDDRLRTNVPHIYAAGDCTGGHQFTHFAGWQAFQAVRNALLPGSSSGFSAAVPWVTFTDPEVAHVGLTEAQARERFGVDVRVAHWSMARTDRAVCEHDQDGFIKVVHTRHGALLGATIVASRAGEAITEFVLALAHGLKLGNLAGAIHAYPTYSTAVQQLASDVSLDMRLAGLSGTLIRMLVRLFH